MPVPFLVVSKGVKFQWAIAPRRASDAATTAARQSAAKQALVELKHALEWAGAAEEALRA